MVTICDKMVPLSWNCLSTCSGSSFTTPGIFKQCLDGLVLAPWVTLSFLGINTVGCAVPCMNSVTCDDCGISNCPAQPLEQSGTLITVGNISQPQGNPIPKVDIKGNWTFPFWDTDKTDKCGAVIKNFQYQFDNTGGATCKITISDEQGSSFEYWINKIVKNIECAQTAYKMRVEYGWAALNPSDPLNANSGCFNSFTTSGDPCSVNCTPIISRCGQDIVDACNAQDGRPCGTRIIARSGPLYFAPREIKPTLQNGRFIFEITGIDLMRLANEQTYSNTFPMNGVSESQIRFRQAVELLLRHATPSVKIAFLAVDRCNAGQFVDMKFWVPPNEGHQLRIRRASNAEPNGCNPGGPGPCDFEHTDCLDACEYETCRLNKGPNFDPLPALPVNFLWDCPNMFSEADGPLGEWACQNKGLYDILKEWLKQVRANDGTCEGKQNGRGIIINWDSRCPTPRLLMWADPFPTCKPVDTAGRCIGTYIVNGGKCSPVIKFEPDMKWIFNAALKSGGNMTPSTARAAQFDNSGPRGGPGQPAPCQTSGGRGIRMETVVPNAEMARNPENAQGVVMQNNQLHTRTNAIQGMLPVEATLTVQGDPAIGSVYESIGKTIGLIVINPYFIRDEDDITPFQKTPGCPYWDTLVRQNTNGVLSQQVVNEVLTNKNWYIRGVSHSIKEGSYQTTYKIYLPVPGADISADLPFGGSDDGYRPQQSGCFAPPGETPDGSDCNVDPQTECEGWSCVPECCDLDPSNEKYCGIGAGDFDTDPASPHFGEWLSAENDNCTPEIPALPPCRIPPGCQEAPCP